MEQRRKVEQREVYLKQFTAQLEKQEKGEDVASALETSGSDQYAKQIKRKRVLPEDLQEFDNDYADMQDVHADFSIEDACRSQSISPH